ncbi:MAG: hypothetical protein AB2417_07315 [Clostridiaceae bacterium]
MNKQQEVDNCKFKLRFMLSRVKYRGLKYICSQEETGGRNNDYLGN